MATSLPPENEMTCSLCLEIFQDPHTLTECSHTFCLQCIEPFKQDGQIQCPTCREITDTDKLQKNTEAEEQCELFRNRDNQESEPPYIEIASGIRLPLCTMCGSRTDLVRYHCPQCEIFMCKTCHFRHGNMKVCKDHTVKPIKETIQLCESKIINAMNELAEARKLVHDRADKVEQNLRDLETTQNQQLELVERVTEENIRKLEEHQKLMKKKIKETNAKVIRDMNKGIDTFEKGREEIQAKIDYLEKASNSEDISVLTEALTLAKGPIRDEVNKLKENFPKIEENPCPNIVVKKSEFWDVTKMIDIELNQAVLANTQKSE